MKKLVSALLVTALVAFGFVATSLTAIHGNSSVANNLTAAPASSSENVLASSFSSESAVLTSSFTVLPTATRKGCDATYNSDCKKCKRLRGGARVRAICYAAAMTRYAACIATAK